MADFLSTLFGGGAEAEAAAQNRALLQANLAKGTDYLNTGYDTGVANLNKAIGAYDPLSALGTKYNAAGDLYLGALGAGGPAGTEAARAAFTNAPGYAAGIDAGLTGINRARALSGRLDSGNTDIDALTFAQNLQNQQYNTWLQNLQQAGGTGVNITGNVAAGQATGYGNLANLGMTNATNLVGLNNTTTSGLEAANTSEAAGKAAGAKNLLGAGLAIAGMVAGGPIGGALAGGMSGMFSGGAPSTGATFGGYGGGNMSGYGSYGGVSYPAL